MASLHASFSKQISFYLELQKRGPLTSVEWDREGGSDLGGGGKIQNIFIANHSNKYNNNNNQGPFSVKEQLGRKRKKGFSTNNSVINRGSWNHGNSQKQNGKFFSCRFQSRFFSLISVNGTEKPEAQVSGPVNRNQKFRFTEIKDNCMKSCFEDFIYLAEKC